VRSPAAAIGWEIGRRHRWGFAAIGLYLIALAAARLAFLAAGQEARVEGGVRFAFAVTVPFSSACMYLMAVFSYGFGGDFAARRSGYPARKFTQPVASAALAGWPMLYGAIAIAVLWLATRALAVWPPDVYLPVLWPALAGAVFLVWTQVLVWTPYRVRGLRAITLVLWLTVIAVIVTVAIELEAGEGTMLALLAPLVPLAFLAARAAIGRARRGGAAEVSAATVRRWAMPGTARKQPFASAARAQLWLEWRRTGRTLPALVALVLPFELALLFVFRDIPDLVVEVLVLVLLTTPFLAAFVAAAASASRRGGSDAYELTPFVAARPVSGTALVAAKLKAAARSTLATWLLVLLATALALRLSGTVPAVVDAARSIGEAFGMPRALALGPLGLLALVAATWKQLVQGLYVGLSGRAWMVRGSVFATLVALSVLVSLLSWASGDVDAALALWRALPWVLIVLVLVKTGAAAWTLLRLHDGRLVRERTLLVGAAAWVVTVGASYALIVWLLELPPSLPRLLPALVAILAVPWVRVAAAPLALMWNRHGVVRRFGAVESGTASGGRWAVATALLFLLAPAGGTLAGAIAFHAGNRPNGAITVAGRQREYLLYVPDSYVAGAPASLVISLHGGASWPAQQMHLSHWNRLADEHGFLVVYPAGRGYPKRWGTFAPDEGLVDDVDFIAALIDRLRADYAIDPARIFANGLSNGGGMAFVLSCALADRIAAVGVVAPAQTLPPSWCASARPVPLIAFQGDADPIVPYGGGPMRGPFTPVRPVFPAIGEWVSLRAQRNGCAASPVESSPATDVSRRSYRDCNDGADVLLFTIRDGGHTWPGGEPLPGWFAGRTTDTIDATRLMWGFFAEHPLR